MNQGQMEFQSQLQKLEKATNIVLMIVRRGRLSRNRIEKEDLPSVACVYHIERSSSFHDVIEIIKNSVIEFYKGPKNEYETRIGIVFRNNTNLLQDLFDKTTVLQAFYFEDGRGIREVRGISGEYGILASADMPNRLLDLVTRPDVDLIRNPDTPLCPHP